ncbi:MAG: enoyl-CoA hydratase/isomerase family protein [Deltaproteobacteria bacterium]|nr:enoyl-CoA hydratase/isomerase family protein [Deltaproteobacteria bacterium]
MEYNAILYMVNDGIAEIMINQPEKMNRLSNQVMQEIVHAVRQSKENDAVKVVIISGAGDKAFCAGADLSNMAQNSILESKKNLSYYAELCLVFHDLNKPSIAKIRGYALAGGCGLAMLPTFSIASEDARFGLPEINVGMWPMMVMATLFRTVGKKKGLDHISTGKIINAHEAEKIGMITKVQTAQELDGYVTELADQLKNKSGSIFKLGLEAFQNAMDMEYHKAIVYLRDQAAILTNTPDSIEGTKAFVEKRKPKWMT